MLKRRLTHWLGVCLGTWMVCARPASADDATCCACDHHGPQTFSDRVKHFFRSRLIGYPEYAIEPPLGEMVRAHGDAMVLKHRESLLVVHRLHFYNDGVHDAELNADGLRHLARIARMLPQTEKPVTVAVGPDQTTPELQARQTALDEARRATVLKQFAAMGVAVTPERVVIARPASPGLAGDDARAIIRNLHNNTRTGGSGVAAPGESGVAATEQPQETPSTGTK